MADSELRQRLGGLDLKSRTQRHDRADHRLRAGKRAVPLTGGPERSRKKQFTDFAQLGSVLNRPHTQTGPNYANKPLPPEPGVGLSGYPAEVNIRSQYPAFFNKLFALRQEMDVYFPEDAYNYYLNEMTKLDSRKIPGKYRNVSFLRETMTRDKRNEELGLPRPIWKMTRRLGQGSFGDVTLWERRTNEGADEGEVQRLAVKDMKFGSFFQDYNNEGNLLRRLNELNDCHNIVEVAEWVSKPNSTIIRMAFEYCDLGDLHDLWHFYWENDLYFPEHFLWHVFYSIASAICFCARGTLDPQPRTDWEEIVHCDIKPHNILLCSPSPTQAYPTLKLADFGLAFTIPNESVRRFKTAFSQGTRDYRAPEMREREERVARGFENMLPGSHSDVYSLGATMGRLMQLGSWHMERRWKEAFHLSKPYGYIYSPELVQLMYECLQSDGERRPNPYELMCRIRLGWKTWEMKLHTNIYHADLHLNPDAYYHGKVLFRSREREEGTPSFSLYQRAKSAEAMAWNTNMRNQHIWDPSKDYWRIGEPDIDPLDPLKDGPEPDRGQQRGAPQVNQLPANMVRQYQAYRPAAAQQPANVAPQYQAYRPAFAQQLNTPGEPAANAANNVPQQYRPGQYRQTTPPKPYRPGHDPKYPVGNQPPPTPRNIKPLPKARNKLMKILRPFLKDPDTPAPTKGWRRPPALRPSASGVTKRSGKSRITPTRNGRNLRTEQRAVPGADDPEGSLSTEVFSQRQFVDFAQMDHMMKQGMNPQKRDFLAFAHREPVEEQPPKRQRSQKRKQPSPSISNRRPSRFKRWLSSSTALL